MGAGITPLMNINRSVRFRPWVGWAALILGFAGLAFIGISLRFADLGGQPLWFDESWTAELTSLPFAQMMHTLARTESTPPLIYWLDWVWVHHFGSNPAELRIIPAMFGSFSVLISPLLVFNAWRIAPAKISRPVALFFSLLMMAVVATSPILIWYSQEARAYSLMVTWSMLIMIATLGFIADRRTVWLAVWSLAACGGLLSHYFVGYLIIATVLAMIFVSRRSLATMIASAPPLIVGAGLIPLLLEQQATGHTDWITDNPEILRLRTVAPDFFFGWTGSWLLALAVVSLLVILAGIGLRRAHSSRLALALLIPAVVSLGGPLVAAGIGFDQILTRNLLAVYPALLVALIAGAMFVGRRARTLSALIVIVIAISGIVVHQTSADNPLWQKPNWPAVVRALGTSPQPRLIVSWYSKPYPLAYDQHDLYQTSAAVTVSEIDVVTYPGWPGVRPKLCFWGAYCQINRSHPVGELPLLAWHRISLHSYGWFDIERFVGPAQALSRADLDGLWAGNNATTFYQQPRQSLLQSPAPDQLFPSPNPVVRDEPPVIVQPPSVTTSIAGQQLVWPVPS
jgi:mannosyltransferase